MTDIGPTRWARLKSSVDAVIDAPSSRVSMLLRRALMGDDSVYAMARSVLRIRSDAEDFLQSDSVQFAPRRASAGSLSAGTLLADRYRVDGLLGSGGMGEVYECFDHHLRERVAVKVLRPDTAGDEEFLARFRAELALGRRIQHPNVCRLYELQSWESKRTTVVFFTMELLAGETLNDRLRRSPLTEAEALPVALQILDGIQAVHDAGILHRDLKCANIMLLPAESGGDGRVVVMDFGLARQLDASEPTLTALARGSFAGTPAYMSPEQLEGRTLTAASDVHALGVILFRMVTGRFPFSGRTDLQMAMHRLNGRARPPRRYAPSISRRWNGTVLACLEGLAGRRPQTAADVADLLQGRTTFRRIRRGAAVATLLGALSVAGLGLDIYRRRPVAPLPETLRHYQLGQEFVDRRQGDDLKQAIVEFEQALAVQSSFAPALVGLAEAYSALSNWGLMDPVEALSKSRDAAERAVRLDGNLAAAHAALGYTVSIDVTHWREATPHFDRALELDPADPKVRLWYSAHLGRLGQSDEAIRQIQTGLAIKPADMLLNHQLAGEYFRGSRYTEFYAQAEELVRLQPFQANSHLVRARALEALGRYDEALEACRTAEKYNLDRSQLVLMLGMIEAGRGRLADAEKHLAEAAQLPRARPVDLAALYGRLGLYDKSIERLRAGHARGDSSVLSAHVTPYFDPMRSYPPFRTFLREIGVP